MPKLVLTHTWIHWCESQWGNTPLIEAANRGYTDIVDHLIAANADANIGSKVDLSFCLFVSLSLSLNRTLYPPPLSTSLSL